jgi:hypothetical protein
MDGGDGFLMWEESAAAFARFWRTQHRLFFLIRSSSWVSGTNKTDMCRFLTIYGVPLTRTMYAVPPTRTTYAGGFSVDNRAMFRHE